MKVYIITRDERDEPVQIMGVWAQYIDMEEAVGKLYAEEEDPAVEYDTHEWDIS